jgi:hypothetical protein
MAYSSGRAMFKGHMAWIETIETVHSLNEPVQLIWSVCLFYNVYALVL